MESGVCGCVSEFDIAGTGAVYIKAYGGTLCFFLPDARAHDQSRRQKTALLQAEIRKAVKRSVVAGSSFDRFFAAGTCDYIGARIRSGTTTAARTLINSTVL